MPYVIALVVVVILGYVFLGNKNETGPAPLDTIAVAEVIDPMGKTPEDDTSGSTGSQNIPDGTHNTQVTYLTPKRDEYALDITLTTRDGVVTDASISYSQGAETDPNAQRFEGAFRDEVIGKKIDELDLSRVGGASLTTAAFNEAVDKILAQDA